MAPKWEQATKELPVPAKGSNTKSFYYIYAWFAIKKAKSWAKETGPKYIRLGNS